MKTSLLLGVFGIALMALSLGGCGQSEAPVQPANNYGELSTRIAGLEDRLATLSNCVQRDELRELTKDEAYRFASIDTDSKGYGKIETGLGTLFVSTQSAEPYLDGYKVHLSIGNPYFVTYSDFKLIASWGPPLTNGAEFTKWSAAQKNKTNEVTTPLYPGAWNAVELILAPATADELRNAQVAIELDKINLREPKKSESP